MKYTIEKMVQLFLFFNQRIYALILAMVLAIPAWAQIGEGGIPKSMDPVAKNELSAQAYIPTISFPAPDIDALRRQDSILATDRRGQLRIGALVGADIDFKTWGSIVTLSDGSKVWRLKIQIPGMQALGLYYDQFQLPEGVKYYVYNSNGRQVLGAFTSNANTDNSIWANEKVQGELMNLEMDIAPGVDISAISLHINNVAVFYRATAYLQAYDVSGANLRTTATYMRHYDSSSSCEVDAVCAPGSSFPNQRNASVHIEYVSHGYVFAASGTMMNNTKMDCAPLLLTATHILNSQNNGNATFANWVIYFNYQKPTCPYTGAEPSSSQTVVGAYFMARAPYDSSSNKLKGDFMLLLLKKNPTTYGFYLAGWDTTNNTNSFIPGTFTSFHHPWGDVKKVSQATAIDGRGSFNGGATYSHWGMEWSTGGEEEGSSGGGLFNASGRLIGILSGGNVITQPCTATNSGGEKMSDYALYSKLAFDWSYLPYSTGPSTRLKDWLDPNGSRVATLNGQTSCTTAVPQTEKTKDGWSVYPNPSSGIINIEQGGGSIANARMEIYNSLGTLLNSELLSAGTGKYKIDLSNYPAGIYLLRIAQGNVITSHKITLTK